MRKLAQYRLFEIIPSRSLDYFGQITNITLERRRTKQQACFKNENLDSEF